MHGSNQLNFQGPFHAPSRHCCAKFLSREHPPFQCFHAKVTLGSQPSVLPSSSSLWSQNCTDGDGTSLTLLSGVVRTEVRRVLKYFLYYSSTRRRDVLKTNSSPRTRRRCGLFYPQCMPTGEKVRIRFTNPIDAPSVRSNWAPPLRKSEQQL